MDMPNYQANSRRSLLRINPGALLATLTALMVLLTPMAQATPMSVNVYGAPYFSLPGDSLEHNANLDWMVLAPAQSLDVDLEDSHINLAGPQALSVHDVFGNYETFEFLGMSLNLPGSSASSSGMIDYLMGGHSGTFSVHQISHRAPFLNADATLSVLLWGIDYLNDVGFILGMESISSTTVDDTPTSVSEPSLLMLLLLGFAAYVLSLYANRHAVQLRVNI